jgi:hypothetical protein
MYFLVWFSNAPKFRAGRIGISLGDSVQKSLESVREIKKLEENRTLILLKKDIVDSVYRDAGPSNLLMSKVSNLSGDLVDDLADEEDVEDHLDQPYVGPNPRKLHQRKVYNVSKVRRSTRKKFKKVF